MDTVQTSKLFLPGCFYDLLSNKTLGDTFSPVARRLGTFFPGVGPVGLSRQKMRAVRNTHIRSKNYVQRGYIVSD